MRTSKRPLASFIVVSLEVVEHICTGRGFTQKISSICSCLVVSRLFQHPFIGYFKNLAIALAGKFDDHWAPLWDNGHIKFWSEYTLRYLLCEATQSIDFIASAALGLSPNQ